MFRSSAQSRLIKCCNSLNPSSNLAITYTGRQGHLISRGLLDERSKSLRDSPGEIVIIKNAAARFLFISLGHLKKDLRLKDKR